MNHQIRVSNSSIRKFFSEVQYFLIDEFDVYCTVKLMSPYSGVARFYPLVEIRLKSKLFPETYILTINLEDEYIPNHSHFSCLLYTLTSILHSINNNL